MNDVLYQLPELYRMRIMLTIFAKLYYILLLSTIQPFLLFHSALVHEKYKKTEWLWWLLGQIRKGGGEHRGLPFDRLTALHLFRPLYLLKFINSFTSFNCSFNFLPALFRREDQTCPSLRRLACLCQSLNIRFILVY